MCSNPNAYDWSKGEDEEVEIPALVCQALSLNYQKTAFTVIIPIIQYRNISVNTILSYTTGTIITDALICEQHITVVAESKF